MPSISRLGRYVACGDSVDPVWGLSPSSTPDDTGDYATYGVDGLKFPAGDNALDHNRLRSYFAAKTYPSIETMSL